MENGIGQQAASECGHRKPNVKRTGEYLYDASAEQGEYSQIKDNSTPKSTIIKHKYLIVYCW